MPTIFVPEMEPRDLVIKVKYGDTLKRFGAYVHGQSMDHNMSKLRAKITNLFKFSPDADLVLTYIDDDGDVVTLDNDEELHDAAVNQRLNPLRINVQLKTCESSENVQEASWSPQIETSPLQFVSAVGEAMKSVPEPLHGALLKFFHDLELKAASSVPNLAEFVEYFSKFRLSDVNLPSHGLCGSQGTSSGPSNNLMDFTDGDETKATVDPVPTTVLLGTTNSGNPEHIPKQNEKVNIIQSSNVATSTSIDLNLDPPRNPCASNFSSAYDLLSCIWEEIEKGGGDVASNPSLTPYNTVGVAEVLGEDSSRQFPIAAAPKSQSQDSHSDVRYKGVPTPVGPVKRLPFPKFCRRPHSYHATFHRGVQCDGCGMYPIMGTWFKSNVKVDYDLCSFCFSEMGNQVDYTRIERAPYQSPRPFKKSNNPHFRYIPPSRPFHGCGVVGPSGVRRESPRAKLESRFIKDVTVTDGTVMPPCTPFTKIWRMRNSGTIVWPFGTQLLWIGGDPLGTRGSAQLVISIDGCPVDEEIDIAVDFISPSNPGSYISIWRLASSSGGTFGQEIWAQIQVGNPQQSYAGGFRGDLNLNLPPEIFDQNGLGIIDVNIDPRDAASDIASFLDAEAESSATVLPSTTVELVMPDSSMGASDGHAQPAPQEVTPVSYPVVDAPESLVATDNPVEESLLKELEEMGFKQLDLNKEVLRVNEYDLERSVDVLCDFAEWNPLLADLKEMGFHDKELNKKLLVKNNGSIKRVVLDLIAGEKGE